MDAYLIWIQWLVAIFGGIFGGMYFFKLLYEHYFFKKYTRMGYIQALFRVYNTFSLFLKELEKRTDRREFIEEVQGNKGEKRWRYLFHEFFYNLDPEIYSRWIDVKNNLVSDDFSSYFNKLSEAVDKKLRCYRGEYIKIISSERGFFKNLSRRSLTVYTTLVMLSYAWFVHFFYGFVLDRTRESPIHSGFWSILYPVSVFLFSYYYSKSSGLSKREFYKIFISTFGGGLLLCYLLWEKLISYIPSKIFWSLIIIVFVASILFDTISILTGTRRDEH